MAENVYPSGSKVKLSTICKALDSSGVAQLTDPTTLTLKVLRPDGTVDTYTYVGATITRDGLGLYHHDYSVAQSGYYTYQFSGTGSCEGASPARRFEVPANPFA